jgi:hypothetical protein
MSATQAVRKQIEDSPDRNVHAAIRNDRLTFDCGRPSGDDRRGGI